MVLALVGRHNFSLSADFDNATAGIISTGNTFLTQNAGTCREVRALDSRHQLRNFHIWVINQHNKAVNNLAQIVRRNISSHTYCDTGTAINQQGRDLRRKYTGLFQGFIIVRYKINCILFDILEHRLSNFSHTYLGITHCCRTVAVNAAEVTVAVYHQIAGREILRQAHDCIIYRTITMRMIFT